jgi:uncharacterized membrane protein
MDGIFYGAVFLCYGIFLLFFSGKEKKNMLGYKSLQQNLHKEIWKWTNQCFGLLAIVGAVVYLIISVIQEVKNITLPFSLYKYVLVYIGLSILITECYGLIKRYSNHGEKFIK